MRTIRHSNNNNIISYPRNMAGVINECDRCVIQWPPCGAPRLPAAAAENILLYYYNIVLRRNSGDASSEGRAETLWFTRIGPRRVSHYIQVYYNTIHTRRIPLASERPFVLIRTINYMDEYDNNISYYMIRGRLLVFC